MYIILCFYGAQFQKSLLSIELKNGQPRLILLWDKNSVLLNYNFDENSGPSLSDNRWHRLDVIWTRQVSNY